MTGWLTSTEAASLFGVHRSTLHEMVKAPEHQAFAARVSRTGRTLRFPAAVTWYYAHEGRMPEDRDDLADFLQHFPVPDVTAHRREARLVRESA